MANVKENRKYQKAMKSVKGATMSEITEVNETTHIKANYDKQTNINWIYTTNSQGGGDNTMTIANKLVKANEHLNIIIQREKALTADKTTRENAVLKDLKELRQLVKENHYIYEIIPEHLPRYFFMDIDISYYYWDNETKEYKEKLTEDEKEYIEKNDITEILLDKMRAILDIQLEDVVILQSLPATEKQKVRMKANTYMNTLKVIYMISRC
jgi:hypothetical protein